MKPVAKISWLGAGYVVAIILASTAVAIHVALMSGPDARPRGMYAFGDSVLFVAAFGVAALLPTGAALFFLRPYSCVLERKSQGWVSWLRHERYCSRPLCVRTTCGRVSPLANWAALRCSPSHGATARPHLSRVHSFVAVPDLPDCAPGGDRHGASLTPTRWL